MICFQVKLLAALGEMPKFIVPLMDSPQMNDQDSTLYIHERRGTFTLCKYNGGDGMLV